MLNLTVNDFLKQLSSDAPAPGGGSASALAGALAAALVNMVANLTRGKEKFAEVEDEMVKLAQDAEDIRQQLMSLMEEDTKAFQQVMSAFRLPKETENEKKQRQDKIQEAMIYAAEVPLKTAQTALKVLELAQIAAEKGNPNAISDAEVAALLAWAALEGAALNVEINLGSIRDKEEQKKLSGKIESALELGGLRLDEIIASVRKCLGTD